MMALNQINVKIPIIYDTIRNIDNHKMLRCNYFSVQTDEPLPNWHLGINNESYPILLLNLEAIIIGAPKSPELFRNPLDIDDMYNSIEENTDLFVDINDIWIPQDWFKLGNFIPGSVFRISQKLFTSCWKYRNDQIDVNEFISSFNEKEDGIISFSEDESAVYNEWTKLQIQQSQEIYRQNQNKLKKLQ